MNDQLQDPVADDEIRISVQVGRRYEPGTRLGAALDELVAALQEANEVEGFGTGVLGLSPASRSFVYSQIGSSDPKWGALGPSINPVVEKGTGGFKQ